MTRDEHLKSLQDEIVKAESACSSFEENFSGELKSEEYQKRWEDTKNHLNNLYSEHNKRIGS